VVQFSFLLKGQSAFHFSVNDPSGHNCRISVHANSAIMRKDLDKKDPRSYAPVLDETGAALAPDTWHTMLVELNGEDMLARIDDAVFLYGTHPGINREKKEREYLFVQAPEVKKAWEAFAAANQAKAKTATAAGKK
jgi:hypothetical protein